MYRVILALAMLMALGWGCASTGRQQGLPVTDDDDELGRIRLGVDSAAALYSIGDVSDFLTVRDSLKNSVGSIVKSHPALKSDPEFKQLLKSLDDLDSMLTLPQLPSDHLEETDSLALAVQDWPETEEKEVQPSKRHLQERREPRYASKKDSEFPELENDRIDFWLRYYTGPGKERFARTLYRMELYRPTVERILDELELPHELIAVAMIESGFNLKARSRARAVGPWQFIAGTARMYGLRVNWWYDERRDIVASTYAAGNYLKDLYGIWKSWPLALAAYNCGEYRVARAVAASRTSDFWKLRLPKQTERYVPKFLATLYILRDPKKYGFTIPDVEPIKFDEVKITDATDLKLVAKSAGSSEDVLRDLNPNVLRWATPPKMEIMVKVPKGEGEKARRALAEIPPEERVTWRKHRVKKGETLSVIARRYRTTITTLKRLNGIRNAHRIRAGKYLIVPMQGAYAEVASTKPQYTTKRRNLDKKALEKYASRYAPPANSKRVVYRVKGGDTLGQIAEDFRTSAKKLRGWNNLAYRSYIYPGQKLVIYVPKSFNVARVAGSSASEKPNEQHYFKQSYTVKRGDTIYSISKRFDVNMSDLLAWNDRSMRNSRIYPGQKLDIWKKK